MFLNQLEWFAMLCIIKILRRHWWIILIDLGGIWLFIQELLSWLAVIRDIYTDLFSFPKQKKFPWEWQMLLSIIENGVDELMIKELRASWDGGFCQNIWLSPEVNWIIFHFLKVNRNLRKKYKKVFRPSQVCLSFSKSSTKFLSDSWFCFFS